jgi:hypothetical protein
VPSVHNSKPTPPRHRDEATEQERLRRNKLITVTVCALIFLVLAGTTTLLLFTIEGGAK